MTRRRALLGMAAGGVGITVIAALLRQRSPQMARQSGLYMVQGAVTVNGSAARTGVRIVGGSEIATGPGALAVFSVGDNAFLMRENSRASFAGQDVVLSALQLISGKLLSVFARRQGVNLSTPTATIGIRGTGAYLEAEPDRTYFCLCYGSAEIASANGSMRAAYTTTHHESPRYIYNDGRTNTIAPASVINHTDSELIMLETLVGRMPPEAFMTSPNRY